MNHQKITTILTELTKINQELPMAEVHAKTMSTIAENLNVPGNPEVTKFQQKARALKTRYDELCLELFMLGNNEQFKHN